MEKHAAITTPAYVSLRDRPRPIVSDPGALARHIARYVVCIPAPAGAK